MSKFRVSRFLQRDLVVRVNFLNEENNGWYETADQVLLDSLKEATEQLPYSAETEAGLKRDKVQYEYAYCASCGGNKVRKLKYNLFEVVD